MMNSIRLRLVLGIVLGVFCSTLQGVCAEKIKYNVLFIAVDDLRPQLGCYGDEQIKSPNIDALAKNSMVFSRAYCQQALCNPTRASLLTGRRPDTLKIRWLSEHFRAAVPNVITLPQYFKQNGYYTVSLGKIYHSRGLDDPPSWSEPSWRPPRPGYGKQETLDAMAKARKAMQKKMAAEGYEHKDKRDGEPIKDPKTGRIKKAYREPKKYAVRGPAWEDPDVPDNALKDGCIADKAIEVLDRIKDKPFFLAVGFFKPHLPFAAPKKYFDLYPIETIQLAPNPLPPKNVPAIALWSWGELRQYKGMPKEGPLPDETARALRRAYNACVSYTDAQIGRLLKELDRLDLAKNTIVVLWGDHGWQLGEHGLWSKFTNFELATRAPLIVRVPQTTQQGAYTNAIVEFVDIYPTLCELAGLTLPEGLEGTSFVPVIKNPDQAWKQAAFSQHPRADHEMGYSMRTDRYRYTEWHHTRWGIPDGEPIAIELYDHATDPDENVNVAGEPDQQERIADLHKRLKAGWKAAGPQ